MTMTRTNITDLVDDLGHSQTNSTMRQESFDDVMERLAKSTGPFVDTETFTPTDGTAEYSYPSSAITILSVFHGARELGYASSKDLEAYDEDWRAASEGDPYVFSFYERDSRKVLLFPTPSTTEADGGTFLFTKQRTTDIPEWLALVLVVEIMAEEFSYPSDHQDKEFAAMCAKVAQFLRIFTGVL